MPVTEMVVGLSVGLFGLLAFIYALRFVQAWMLHRTLREAIRQDSAQAGLLVDRIGRSDFGGSGGAGSDDRTGIVLVALGIALAGFSLIAGDADWLRYGLGGALFPILVGAALLVRYRIRRRSAEPDVASGA